MRVSEGHLAWHNRGNLSTHFFAARFYHQLDSIPPLIREVDL
jgi:hypothetical protein